MAHTILIADDRFASRERSLLQRVAIGLATNGWRPVLIAPAGHELEQEGIYADVLAYRAPKTMLGVRYTLASMQRRIDALLSEVGDISLVHAFGARSWSVAHGLSGRLGIPLVLEIWNAGTIASASRVRARPETGPVTLAAADPVLAAMLREAHLHGAIRSTPWGVHPPERSRELLAPGRSPSVALIGEPGRPEVARAALIALCEVGASRELLVLIDAELCESARLWPVARARGLSPTLVPPGVRRDDLLSEADFTMITHDAGCADTSVLSAMASGSVLVASHACRMNAIEERSAVRTIDADASPGAWADTLTALLDDPDQARELGERGRRHVAKHRLASQHVGAVIDTYEWVLSRDSMPIGRG